MTKRDWFALAAILALGLALRAPVAGLFLERDEGEYAYIAQRWIRGDIPYRDSFDQKPPGVFAAYAVMEKTLGESAAAIHWGAELYTLLTLALLFLIGRGLFGPEAGFAAGALAALMTADRSFLGNAANCELFMLLPMTAGLACVLKARAKDSWRWAAASGACAGLSLLFKQVALTNAAFCLGLLLLSSRVGRKALCAGAFVAAAAAVWLPVIAYFWLKGAWASFYECVIGYNLSYAGGIPLSDYIRNFWATFSRTLPALAPVYFLALAGGVTGGPDGFLLLGWLAASALGVLPGGFFRPHYYLQAVPALALLAGAALVDIRRRWRWPSWAGFCAAAVLVAYGVANNSWYYGRATVTEKCHRLYGWDNPFAEAVGIGQAIAQRTAPEDKVFVFGSEPEILYHAGRRSATRFIFVYPLFQASVDSEARQREAMEQVRASDPKAIVTVFVRKSFLPSLNAPLGIFDEVQRLLKGYHIEAVVLSNPRNPTQLLSDQAARDLWRKFPMWYDRPFWGTLALWIKDR